MSIQMSPFQKAQIARREANLLHRVETINYHQNIIVCKCGETMPALLGKHDIASPFWTAHLRESGVPGS